MTTPWNETTTARLKEHIFAGTLSCTQMAEALNNEFRPLFFSRNGVIGKAHRIGLRVSSSSKRTPHGAPKEVEQVVVRVRNRGAAGMVKEHQPQVQADLSAFQDDLSIPLKQRRSILGLDSTNCHWPFGDDPHDRKKFFFCGAPAVKGLPYCAGHCQMAYKAPQPRTHVHYRGLATAA